MKGFVSCHPLTVEVLKHLGVKSDQVSQGIGNNSLSAGYHLAVGKIAGKKFGVCVDLSYALADWDFLAEAWSCGLVAFSRNWPGNEHLHCVHLDLLDDEHVMHLPDGPRQQVVDFLHMPKAHDGLKSHSTLGPFAPNAQQQAEVRRLYSQSVPDYPTRVLAPGKQQIACSAWLEGDTVTVNVKAFLAWWGCSVNTGVSGGPWIAATLKGDKLNLPACGLVFDGRFWRAPVRDLARLIKLRPAFTWDKPRWSCAVQLAYA